MKKLLSAALAAALLVTPALADQDQSRNYFNANGIPILQETPQTLTLDYIAYVKDDPSTFLLRTGEFRVDQYTVEPAEAEGYQVVTLQTTSSLDPYLSAETGTSYGQVRWTYGVYDYYTGRQFPRRDTVGSAFNEYTQTISYNGMEYPVSYTHTSLWTFGQHWEIQEDGSSILPGICQDTWTFTIPSGYNGLVYGLFATPEVPGLDPDKLDTRETYAKKDEKSPQYFRFGHMAGQEQPDGGKLDVSIQFDTEGRNLDNGIGYQYQLTNRTDAPVRRYAALITYRPNRRWEQVYDPARGTVVDNKNGKQFFVGQIHAMDVDLQAGETKPGSLVSEVGGISSLSVLWLEFDDLAERDRFLEDSVFGEISTDSLQGYRTIDGTAGSAWMWDTFHIEIGPAV